MVEEKGKQAEERQDEPRLWRPWRPPRRQLGWRVLWAVGMVVAVLTTGLLIVDLRPEIWKDLLEGRVLTLVALGFSLAAIVVMLAIAGARRSWTGFQGKTVWDFLQLLIVPLMLVAIGFWFTAQQDARQQEIENKRAQQAQKIENRRAEAERELADQRAQDETLQAYLDQMGSLLLERDLRESKEDSDVRRLARARTLVVLETLDSARQNRVLRFLEETELIQARPPDRPPIISLKYASLRNFELFGKQLLRGTDLTQADLSGAELSETHLEGTDLSLAHLGAANLRGAYLNDAKLNGAYLYDTDLRGADMSGADLSDVEGRIESGAHMIRTRLAGADLRGADLTNADLSAADLTNAQVTEEQLREAESLEGATMPNAQKYEDWIKDQEGRK